MHGAYTNKHKSSEVGTFKFATQINL